MAAPRIVGGERSHFPLLIARSLAWALRPARLIGIFQRKGSSAVAG